MKGVEMHRDDPSLGAKFIASHPLWWLCVSYAVVFTACSAAMDLLGLTEPQGPSVLKRYLFPIAIAVGNWYWTWRAAVYKARQLASNSDAGNSDYQQPNKHD